MYRVFSILVLFGLMVWGFLMLEKRNEPERSYTTVEEGDRCAQFRETEGDTWSLGYAGRIRQLINGCF